MLAGRLALASEREESLRLFHLLLVDLANTAAPRRQRRARRQRYPRSTRGSNPSADSTSLSHGRASAAAPVILDCAASADTETLTAMLEMMRRCGAVGRRR